jgi:hypothetical protein
MEQLRKINFVSVHQRYRIIYSAMYVYISNRHNWYFFFWEVDIVNGVVVEEDMRTFPVISTNKPTIWAELVRAIFTNIT